MTSPESGEGGEGRDRLPPSVDVDLPPTTPPPAPETAPAPSQSQEPPTAAPATAATTAPENVTAGTAAPAATATSLPTKPPVPRERRPLNLANHALGRSEIAFLAMLAIGEALAFGQDLIGGIARSNVTVARLGGLYVFGSLRVPIQLRASASGVRGTFLDVSVALLTITAVGVVLLFRGGESVGTRASGGLVRRGLWGATVGLPFGLFVWLLSLLVGFHFRIQVIEGGQVAIGVSKPLAAVIGLGVGIVVGCLGGVWSGLSRATRSVPQRAGAPPVRSRTVLASGAVAGAWRMFLAALALSFLGLLVLAGLKPDATRAYLDRTTGRGASGFDLLAHHVLALPNQSMFVLVPAMGGCDRVEGTGEPRTFLCMSKIPVHGGVNLLGPLLPGKRRELRSPFAGVRFGSPPAGFLLFLLIPLGASVLGGIRAARPAGSRTQAAAAGALAGVGFAALVVAACVAAALSIKFYGGQVPASLTILPDPAAGAVLGLVWGILGGTVGAFAGWRAPVRKVKPAPSPQPATATSAPTGQQPPAGP